jgi:hypothetical protein
MSLESRAGARCVLLAAVPLAAMASACGADVEVKLGRAWPDPLFGDEGRVVANINGSAEESSPTLTADLLEIYFGSARAGLGGGDVWWARRSDRVLAFDPPELLAATSSADREVSPVISADGLTLWVGSDRPGGSGGIDIWQAERPSRSAEWGELRNVSELNSVRDDLPRPLGYGERVMPLASRREDRNYQTYLARRASAGGPWLAVEAVNQLWLEGSAMQGGFLTADGLQLFFHRETSTSAELFLSWRRSLSEPFVELLALTTLNVGPRQRDPWVSADESRFFFTSDRQPEGGFDIYGTTLDLPRFE